MPKGLLKRAQRTPKIKKKTPYGRILKTIPASESDDGRERHLHATKGWRSYRG